MMKIEIMIPMKFGNSLSADVLDGIIRQRGIRSNITPIICSRQGVSGRQNEAYTRNRLFSVAADRGYEMFLMMDDDIILTEHNSIESSFVQLLAGGNNLGAVHIHSKPGEVTGHMDIGCVALRGTVAGCIAFDTRITDCHCDSFGDKLRAHDFRQEWLHK